MYCHGTLQTRENSHMLLINNGTDSFVDATTPRERSPSFLMAIEPALDSVLTVSGLFLQIERQEVPALHQSAAEFSRHFKWDVDADDFGT